MKPSIFLLVILFIVINGCSAPGRQQTFVLSSSDSILLFKKGDSVKTSAQQIKNAPFEGSWNFFWGCLGKKLMCMNIYIYNNDSAKGFYVDDSCKTKIFLKGSMKNFNNLELTEYRDNKVIGFYAATRDSPALIAGDFKGEWTDSSHSMCIPFNFSEGSSERGSYERRFSLFTDKTDSEVENFAMQVKVAILNSDKKWLADHVEYPFTMTVERLNKNYVFYSVRIANKSDFINKIGKYITHDYKAYIKSACPLSLAACRFIEDGNSGTDMQNIIISSCKRQLCIKSILIPNKNILSKTQLNNSP